MKKYKYGNLEFSCSLSELNRGFSWAKEQALAYVHDGEDPVGLWYEAALPARDAFCMRDTAHHAQARQPSGFPLIRKICFIGLLKASVRKRTGAAGGRSRKQENPVRMIMTATVISGIISLEALK